MVTKNGMPDGVDSNCRSSRSVRWSVGSSLWNLAKSNSIYTTPDGTGEGLKRLHMRVLRSIGYTCRCSSYGVCLESLVKKGNIQREKIEAPSML